MTTSCAPTLEQVLEAMTVTESADWAAHMLVVIERVNQIAQGHTPDHDDREHQDASLPRAAVAYALASAGKIDEAAITYPWPNPPTCLQTIPQNPTESFGLLVKAAALLKAELARLRRFGVDYTPMIGKSEAPDCLKDFVLAKPGARVTTAPAETPSTRSDVTL